MSFSVSFLAFFSLFLTHTFALNLNFIPSILKHVPKDDITPKYDWMKDSMSNLVKQSFEKTVEGVTMISSVAMDTAGYINDNVRQDNLYFTNNVIFFMFFRNTNIMKQSEPIYKQFHNKHKFGIS